MSVALPISNDAPAFLLYEGSASEPRSLLKVLRAAPKSGFTLA
jgi:hypothetical protein